MIRTARLTRVRERSEIGAATTARCRARISSWERWCGAAGVKAISPRRGDLAAFIRESGLAPSTLRVTLSALSAAHRRLQLPDSTREPEVRRALATVTANARAQRQAAAAGEAEEQGYT